YDRASSVVRSISSGYLLQAGPGERQQRAEDQELDLLLADAHDQPPRGTVRIAAGQQRRLAYVGGSCQIPGHALVAIQGRPGQCWSACGTGTRSPRAAND